MKRFLSLILSAALAFGTIANITFTATVSAADAATVVRLDPSNASPFNNGEFEGWGTALCWWANRLGYSTELTQQAADAFFSEDGLGLDIARYNLGGGDDPSHNHITRSDSKVPGVWKTFELSSDGKDVTNITYDVTNDQNQLNIAKAALAANPNLYFEGFSNSAPYFMTVSGCTGGGDPASSDNLKSDMYDDFAKFIADGTKLLAENGIVFKSYSPMNEPDTNYWGVLSPKQEGCHFTPGTSQSNMIIETRKALDAEGLDDVLVAGMDETSIDKSVLNLDSLTDAAKTALGRIDTHTYDGSKRAQLKAKAIEMGKDLWMSEVDGGWNGFGLAQRIIEDMNGMMPSAWVMWDIIDSHRDNTSDMRVSDEATRTLDVTGKMWGVGMANHDAKEIELANKYYFYGQFTRYINPGDTIIASSSNTLAAYNKTTGDIKIVALNSGSSDQAYTFDLGAFTNVGTTVKEIRTNNATGSSEEHWKEITDEATLTGKKLTTTLKAGTLTTYVVSGASVQGTNYISVNGADSVSLGDGAQFTYNTDLTNNTAPVYSVSDDTIAEIDASGNLTTKNKGTVTVTVTIGEVSGSKDVEVIFEIAGSGEKVKRGSSVQLSAGKNLTGVTWESLNPEIAEISETGLLTAKAPGTVTVKATYGTNTAEKTFIVPSYTVTGTASWNADDATDYTKAADDNLNTYFDGLTGGWVRYDYGEPYTVTKVKLAPRSGSTYTARTVGGTVQGSNDGITWTELYKITSALTEGQYTEIPASELSSQKAYRYFRYINETHEANISEFIIEGSSAESVAEDEPVVTDIEEFTDDFEGGTNIFGATAGTVDTGSGNTVFASGLGRYEHVMAPVKATATSTLAEAVTLTNKQKFRLTFDMFAGWEDKGKENTLVIKDEDGNEVVAIYITGGGYTLQEIRVGGKNVMTGTAVAQSKSNASGNRMGANGWNVSNQPYRNNVGYNKKGEITIDGAGNVSVSLTGGMADTSVTGQLKASVSIGSLSLTGDYNVASNRVVAYDNFDGDVITYNDAFTAPTPKPTQEPEKELVIPENGELIHLNFDGDLTSESEYGKATAVGTAKFATVDEKQVIQFDGTNATAIKLTDANGNPLLTGQKNLTISFKIKPTQTTPASWWFFAAPNDTAQTYQKEKYLGAHTKDGKLNVERYNNSGSRSAMATSAITMNDWNDVEIHVNNGSTSVFVNGALQSSVDSTVNIADMLGSNSVLYIGLANWGSGEYATGYMDDFVIKNYSLPTVSAYRSGDVMGYTSDYSEADGYDMFIAVRDNKNNLIGASKGAEGSFELPEEDGVYTITEYLWKNMEPITDPITVTPETITDGYLFAHFVGDESNADMEQIYFSLSTDGSSWKTINSGAPVLTSDVGEKGVRDPYIMRTEDGKFVIIATDLSIYNLGKTQGSSKWGYSQTNGSKNIVIWKSDDLVNWSDANLVKVALDTAGCTWAPEAFYDEAKQQYMVFWASKVSDDSYAKQRMYRSYTTDFETFTAPEVYIDNASSAIDTTIIKEGDTYYRFTKDETHSAVTMMKSTSLSEGWTDVDTYTINNVAGNTVTGYEGPTVYKINGEDKWCLLLDYYSKSQGYKPFVTNDITVGAFTSAGDFKFDATYRHGTVMPITGKEYIRLLGAY